MTFHFLALMFYDFHHRYISFLWFDLFLDILFILTSILNGFAFLSSISGNSVLLFTQSLFVERTFFKERVLEIFRLFTSEQSEALCLLSALMGVILAALFLCSKQPAVWASVCLHSKAQFSILRSKLNLLTFSTANCNGHTTLLWQ